MLITTLLDFFRLPTDFPGYTTDSLKLLDIEEKVKEAIAKVMDVSCFGFNIVVDDEESLHELQLIIDSYPTPEDINGGVEAAPSKRLMHISLYEKTIDGEMILEALRIDDIRDRCPRFNKWMTKLEEGIQNGHF